MNGWLTVRAWMSAALLAVAGVGAAPGADAPAAEPIVELPPLIVADSAGARPWRYAAIDGVEVLSRCDDAITCDWLQRHQRLTELFALVLPPDLQFRTRMPVTIILVDAAATPALSATLVRQFGRDGAAPAAGGPHIRLLPNLELGDVDALTSFAIVDPRVFDADRLGFAPEHLQMLLRLRVPPLPPWLVEGYAALLAELQFREKTVELPALQWTTYSETERLRSDPEAPRRLLSAEEFFNRPVPPDDAALHQLQAKLFIRWCVSDPERRLALWRFVTDPAPVSDATLRRWFGLGFSDWRDVLSDTLPAALRRPVEFGPAKLAKLPVVKVRDATPAEVGRMKGEWERLAARFVRQRQPRFVAQYVELARRTLQAAQEAAGPEPRLCAVRGLLEADAGDLVAARPFLELAGAAGRSRPRVHAELAAFRLADALESERDKSGLITPGQAEVVLDELRRAQEQLPPLAQVEVLRLETWLRVGVVFDAPRIAAADAAVARFPASLPLLYFAALAHRRAGDLSGALALADRALAFDLAPRAREQFVQLRQRLSATPQSGALIPVAEPTVTPPRGESAPGS